MIHQTLFQSYGTNQDFTFPIRKCMWKSWGHLAFLHTKIPFHKGMCVWMPPLLYLIFYMLLVCHLSTLVTSPRLELWQIVGYKNELFIRCIVRQHKYKLKRKPLFPKVIACNCKRMKMMWRGEKRWILQVKVGWIL